MQNYRLDIYLHLIVHVNNTIRLAYTVVIYLDDNTDCSVGP